MYKFDTVQMAPKTVWGDSKLPAKERQIPWKVILGSLIGISTLACLILVARLSSLMTRRTSIAAITHDGNRIKIRGIIVPSGDALTVTPTDIKAVAYVQETKRYGHNGWQRTGVNDNHVPCTLDDGTACIDINLTFARMHFNHGVSLYNGIAGELAGRNPYVDDILVSYRYIPVGAVVTIIGTPSTVDNVIHTTKNVHVFDGDERTAVLSIKLRAVLCICLLLLLTVIVNFV